MRVWVTRAQPEAAATAERLRALGHEPLVAPVLEIRSLPCFVDTKGVAAIAFTSRNGVRFFPPRHGDVALPVFTVGDATAAAAREAGFRDIRSAGADGAALAELLTAELDPGAGAVLVVRPRQPGFDLEGALSRRGFDVRSAVVYESRPISRDREVSLALRAEPPLRAVLVHSPRAANQVAHILAGAPERTTLIAFCISQAAARPLRPLGLAAIEVAPFPNETSLLKLLPEPPFGRREES